METIPMRAFKKDFEMHSPLVRKGKIIAFHDIVPGPSEHVGGVPEFWKEILKCGGYIRYYRGERISHSRLFI
jgi:hypothetical protein